MLNHILVKSFFMNQLTSSIGRIEPELFNPNIQVLLGSC